MPNDGTSSAEHETEKKGQEFTFCPFLGFEDDPDTALAYPAPENFCYHCKPIAPVNLAHQRSVCLTRDFNQCPVYSLKNLEPLPKAFRGSRLSRYRRKRFLPLLLLASVVLVVLIAVFLLRLNNPGGQLLAFSTKIPTVTVELPTVEPSKAIPSSTPEPSATPAPTQTKVSVFTSGSTPRAIETPFGTDPKLVIHRVKEGEGYILLAEEYNTTVDAIKAINEKSPDPLWVNSTLVIPVNTDDVRSLPQFSIVEITTEGLTIEDFAQRMQLDPEKLKLYNALPEGYLLSMGEMIIIPK